MIQNKTFARIGTLIVTLAVCLAAQTDPPLTQYRSKVLLRNLSNPTSIAFLPDGRAYVTLKNGTIRLVNPTSGDTSTAAMLPAANVREDGLHALVLDPAYATNRWVYVLFSERSPGDTAIVVARYTTDSASGALLTGSRQTLLKVPYTINSGQAEHNTGTLAFAPDGNLFVALADNTQNVFSGNGQGSAPRDPTRPLYDAQRSAANTNDLRGKILRIRPTPEGTYTIPAGNLFAPGTANTRPEIYVMGVRHPFRITVDALTGWLYWAEPGPNASTDNFNATNGTGPRGYEEVNLAKTPGNYGWPYCVGNNACYTRYNYSNNSRLDNSVYNPDSLRNTSANNTGLTELPPGRPATVWYAYNSTTPTGFPYPMFGNASSNAGMLGPLYRYNGALTAPGRLPAHFDRHLFIVEWQRSQIFVARVDSVGGLQNVRSFWSSRDTTSNGPIDVKIGPDGSLYLLNWVGSTYPSNSGNGTLTRLEYTGVHVGIAPSTARASLRPVGDLLVFGPGSRVVIPAGARTVDFYTVHGRRVWTFTRQDPSASTTVAPPGHLQGVVRMRVRAP